MTVRVFDFIFNNRLRGLSVPWPGGYEKFWPVTGHLTIKTGQQNIKTGHTIFGHQMK